MLIIFCAALVFTVGGETDFRTKTVRVGEDVSLTCSRQAIGTGILFWIKLVAGNFPEVLGATYTFDNSNVKKTSHFTVKQEPGTFVLHITHTRPSDTAFYYCEQVVELQTTVLNKTFLRVKGPEPDISDFVSENNICPENLSVYWYRAGSDTSNHSVHYAHGNGDACEKSPQKCVYKFSKNVSSSDAGTYYCAVATCGAILFGKEDKVSNEANTRFGESRMPTTILFLLCTALVISWTVIAFLIYIIKRKKTAASHTDVDSTTVAQQRQETDEDSLVYYAPDFSKRKGGRSGRRSVNTVEAEDIYSNVRAWECG